MKYMSTDEVITILKTGAAVTFPVQYSMSIFLKLAESPIRWKLNAIVENDEISMQIINDHVTNN